MKAIYFIILALISIIVGIITFLVYPTITTEPIENDLTVIEENSIEETTSNLDLNDTLVVKSDNGVFYLNANDVVIRNGRSLVRYNCSLFQSLGLQLTYNSAQSKFIVSYSDNQGNLHNVTNYVKDLEWYRDGLNAYLADCRSEEGLVPLRAVLSACEYNVSIDNEHNTINIKGA